MLKKETTVTRIVSEEHVAKAFGLTVTQLRYKAATEAMEIIHYSKLPWKQRLLQAWCEFKNTMRLGPSIPVTPEELENRKKMREELDKFPFTF